jgi:membrane-associated phospholipid phosphatase
MDCQNEGISRRGVLFAVAGAIALTVVTQPTQAVAIAEKPPPSPVGSGRSARSGQSLIATCTRSGGSRGCNWARCTGRRPCSTN